MTISSEIDERTLRELYLVPFEAAVAAGRRARRHDRLQPAQRHVLQRAPVAADRACCAASGASTASSSATGSARHSAAASLLAGLDLEMPGPPRERGAAPARRRASAARSASDDLDRSVARVLALAEWTGAADAGTAEVTADDPATRAVIRRAAARGDGAAEERRWRCCRWPATARRVALIGPYARYGRPQGGGSARVRPGPRARSARGAAGTRSRRHVRAGRLDRQVPADRARRLHASSSATTSGAPATVAAEPAGVVLGQAAGRGRSTPATFTARDRRHVRARRDRRRGSSACAPSARRRVRLDGETVVELTEAQRGGAFFGMGSPEVRGTVELEEGRRYELTVDYPAADDELVRGLVVGARPVPAGDHIERAAAAARRRRRRRSSSSAPTTTGRPRARTARRWRCPGDQDELVAAVAAANPNTVVVLNTGSPVTMPWLDDVPAVLQLWFPGQEIGDAPGRRADRRRRARRPAADRRSRSASRTRRRSPTTRAPTGGPSTPRGCSSATAGTTGEGIEPLFPFGFGLGYTTFELGDRRRRRRHRARRHRRRRRCTNTGERDGRRGRAGLRRAAAPATPARPLRHLAGFGRVELAAGRAGHGSRRRSTGGRSPRGSTASGSSQPGEYTIHVGRSSARPRTRRLGHRRRIRASGRVTCALDTRIGPRTRRTGSSEAPVDRVEAGGDERGVGAGERLGAEEAVVRRQRRRVGRLDDRVPVAVDQRLLAPGVAAPEDEHDRVVLGGDGADDLVGERLPAVALVRRRPGRRAPSASC